MEIHILQVLEMVVVMVIMKINVRSRHDNIDSTSICNGNNNSNRNKSDILITRIVQRMNMNIVITNYGKRHILNQAMTTIPRIMTVVITTDYLALDEEFEKGKCSLTVREKNRLIAAKCHCVANHKPWEELQLS